MIAPHDIPVPLEEDECKIFAQWLDLRGWLYTHVGHGGKLSRAQAGIFKVMGLKRGVPDYLIFSRPPGKPYVGVALEMKRQRGGRVSREQIWWAKRLEAEGWLVMLAKGAHDAIGQMREAGY